MLELFKAVWILIGCQCLSFISWKKKITLKVIPTIVHLCRYHYSCIVIFCFTISLLLLQGCTMNRILIMITIELLSILSIIICNIYPLLIYLVSDSFLFDIAVILHWYQAFTSVHGCGCQMSSV